MIECEPRVVETSNNFHWLPLHIACANGASDEVLKLLIDTYPTSKTSVDNRGRTPLHFSVGNETYEPSPVVVELLSDTGAAGYADENGSLPLHYACAYGSSMEVLEVLLEVYPKSNILGDINGRTPLHFAVRRIANEFI